MPRRGSHIRAHRLPFRIGFVHLRSKRLFRGFEHHPRRYETLVRRPHYVGELFPPEGSSGVLTNRGCPSPPPEMYSRPTFLAIFFALPIVTESAVVRADDLFRMCGCSFHRLTAHLDDYRRPHCGFTPREPSSPLPSLR